jgi:hypothetical protein
MSMDKILVMDDEFANVEALLDYFDRCGIEYDYVSSITEGATQIAEAQEADTPYGLVICDNHFHIDELSEYIPNFQGIDFLNILLGSLQGNGASNFAEGYFGEHYEAIQDHYQGRAMLFSGSATLDQNNNPDQFNGILVVQKHPDRDGGVCEDEVIALMEGLGYECGEDTTSLVRYKTDEGLESGVESTAKHQDAVVAFLQDQGLEPDQVQLYLKD